MGQLALLIQGILNREVISYSKVQGKPFYRFEILSKIKEILES